MKIQRVALYVRVSTQEQATDGYWIDSQMRLLNSYSEAQKDLGWQLSESRIYKDEWISGTSSVEERPALTRLKRDIINGEVDVILIYKLDRLFRKTSYLLEFWDFLKEYKVNLVSKSENIDMGSPSGALVVTMLGAIGEMEVSMIRDRTTEGKISKTLEGYYVQGASPFGYRKEFDGRGNKLVIDQEEAKLIRKIFDLYVKDDMTTMSIRSYLNGLGIGTRYDREWPKQKVSENFIHYSFVQKILTNEIYIGKCYTRKRETKKIDGKNRQVYRDKKDWLCTPCPPIVDEDIFNLAQEKLSKGKVLHWRGEIHTFTGLIKCGLCGKSYIHQRGGKGTSNYRCGGKNQSKVSETCKNPAISEDKLLDLVWKQVSAIFDHPEEFIKSYLEKTEDRAETIKKYRLEVLEINEEIQKLDRLTTNAIRKQLEDEFHAKAYQSIIQENDGKKLSLEQRRAELEEKLKDMKSLDEMKEMIRKLAKIYQEEYRSLSLSSKTEYIRAVIDKVVLSPDEIKIVYKFNF